MRAWGLGAARADEALRAVKALGAHRYVGGRLHLVHAFALATSPASAELAQAQAWAAGVLGRADVDASTRHEALWRRCSDAELLGVLTAFWGAGDDAARARHTLAALLARHDLPIPAHAAFDEAAEDEMHPLLVDAGWELVPLTGLDPERHRGAMNAFGDALAFESARFEEETAIPPQSHLYELPALGAVELLRGVTEDGTLAAPLVVWAEGHETYLDYVIRGVRRAAKLPERDED
jgi:hypothetical protein